MTNRRRPGGYYWQQHITDGLQAEADARRQIEAVSRLTSSGTVTAHLLKVALDLGAIRAALSDLKEIGHDQPDSGHDA